MNNDQPAFTMIDCIISTQPAALERVMRVIRIRGFGVQSVAITNEQDLFKASFTLRGERSAINLVRQLEKLIDIKEVVLQDEIIELDQAVCA